MPWMAYASHLNQHAIFRGTLYWHAPDPLKDSIRHPHLVVQDDVFNASRIGTVIVCALSTNLHKAIEPGNVLLDPGEGGLTCQSVVVVSQLSVVDKSALNELIGTLTDTRVEQVLAGLRFQQTAFLRGR
jgi:mRNA interferase MazF